MSNRRLTARDYKGVRRHALPLERLRDAGMGLGAGLLVALVVYVGDRRGQGAATEAVPAPHRVTAPGAAAPRGGAPEAAAARPGAAAGAAGEQPMNYDFYDGLPKFEVVVPEKERGTHVDDAARVDRPGTYFLQAGSYRGLPDAQRVQARLEREGITAAVQRVALDNDVWYRIRIGPIRDLGQLNRVRQQLAAAEIATLVIRVED
jgi:cell division septation protein DedD